MSLTLSQCKKLKEWGLPQGDRCPLDSLARPDLEQLLEFAAPILEEHLFGVIISSLRDPFVIRGRSVKNNSEVQGKDLDPKQAVYQLIEKIMSLPEA